MQEFNLISKLEEYKPIAIEEIKFKKEIIDFVKKYANCYERTLEIGHVTGSSWILSKDHSKALLMHHTKLNNWFQLGGHCDGNPNVLEVAIKEAQEESGIKNIKALSNKIFDIDVHLIPANSKEKEHYHYDIRFLLHVISDELVIQNHESKELKWISKDRDNLPTKSLSVTRMFNKWLQL